MCKAQVSVAPKPRRRAKLLHVQRTPERRLDTSHSSWRPHVLRRINRMLAWIGCAVARLYTTREARARTQASTMATSSPDVCAKHIYSSSRLLNHVIAAADMGSSMCSMQSAAVWGGTVPFVGAT